MPSNEEALQEMPTEFVVCRMLRHNWNFLGFHEGTSIGGRKVITMNLECSHCEMKRHDYLDRQGNLIDRDYFQPEGYALKRNRDDAREGRILSGDARLAMLGRATIYKSSTGLERALRSRNGG